MLSVPIRETEQLLQQMQQPCACQQDHQKEELFMMCDMIGQVHRLCKSMSSPGHHQASYIHASLWLLPISMLESEDVSEMVVWGP